MNNKKHYISAISAFIIWGFFSIPLRALKAFPAGEILYFRILFSSVSLVLLLIIFRKEPIKKDIIFFNTLPKKEKIITLLLTLAGGLLLTVNWITFIYIVNNINIKTASFSYLICPVITAVLGFILIKEKLSMIQWVAVGLCTLSCVFMGLNSVTELGYSFLTALTYAIYLISQRKNQGFDRLFALTIQVLFSFFILNLFFNQLVQELPVEPKFYVIIVIIALVFTVLPLFLNLFALNKINSATIGILMYINPLFNFSVAFVLFDEGVSIIQMIGYVIIALALLLFNFRNFKNLYASSYK